MWQLYLSKFRFPIFSVQQTSIVRQDTLHYLTAHCQAKMNHLKEVPLHAPITWNTFQFKQQNMTNVACFHGQHFWCLRRISCHGRNHSQASCEYSLTIFLCCQHHSEYSLLGSKFSTILLFAASKCHHVTMQQRGSSSVQNGRTGWDRWSGETLLAPCTRKKRLQRKITKHYHWICVQENIGMFSKS